ncbi:unnamed protein product [Trichogramma brassicae]|uniref:Uncharacterized protein n=1 Tax=Trichogramma brassicae TaxID=86971 RepID=A0A6H5I8N0_9HYME|nr:unnamed protein product [Trichogramma brassicae]
MSEDVDMDNPNISELKSLRNNINWTKDIERHYFLEKMYPLIKNWKGQLPNLLAFFQPKEIECLLTDAVKHVFAIQHGKEAVLLFIKFVIETGYRDKPDFDGDGRRLLHRATPVHQEAKRNFFTRDNVIYELLKIYDRFDVIYADKSGFSHFHVVCKYGYVDLIEKFLEAGQDPNCLVRETGDTPLHVALYSEKKEVFELLLKKGANPNVANIKGLTPFHVICQQYYANGDLARKFLQAIYDIGLKLSSSFIIDAPDPLGQTPLHMAVYRRRKVLVELLLNVEIDPNLTDAEGSTALHIVCKSIDEDYKLTEMLFKGCDDKHRLLQVNTQDKEGDTPLIWAVQRQHRKLMEFLLRRGADPTLANSRGLTPLRIVCIRKDDESATILFEHSQDHYKSALVHTRDSLGQLSLNFALDKSHPTLLELLLKHGADPNSACADGWTSLHVIAKRRDLAPMMEKLFEPSKPNYKPPRVDARDKDGNTPLHFAVSHGNRLSMGYLLSKGANPNLANSRGSTPLHLACKSYCLMDWADSFFELGDRMEQRVQLDPRDGRLHTAPRCSELEKRLDSRVSFEKGRRCDCSQCARGNSFAHYLRDRMARPPRGVAVQCHRRKSADVADQLPGQRG